MIHLALRTEYSFKQCYGFIHDIVEIAGKEQAIGIADNANTFGHVKHFKDCRLKGVKPILGVRLMICDKPVEKIKVFGPKYIFIARNRDGLSELYGLVKLAYDQFYYHPRLFQIDLYSVSENIIVIADMFNSTNRIDYIAVNQLTPKAIADWPGIPKVATCINWYTKPDDRQVYQLHAGRGMETQTFPQHILSDEEWLHLWPGYDHALDNTYDIANMCDDYDLPVASMVKFTGRVSLRQLCVAGARKRGISLLDPVYKDRLERELQLIEDKNFSDYFLVVSEMVRKAKLKMLVGPARGSAAGSLVCYLTQITEVDPIKFDLLFERFVDINRADLPDIDIDFPDIKRKLVIKELSDIYGNDHVSRIATIATMKPKSAIGEFAAGLCIPAYETDAVKGAIIERSGGDARAMMRVADTFETTDVGREFIKQYPEMEIVKRIEGHARHSGVHAAGIIVCNEPLTTFGGINSRDSALMMEYKDIEQLNLLKIDCLGLRTLSILESVANQIGIAYDDFYDIPLNDEATFNIFNSLRLSGIFQFQGNALQYVTRQMGVETFDDICAITALARPGPIHSGGTNIFIGRRTGAEPVVYLSQHESVIRHTEGTYGVIIYQEQLMSIGREYGGLSWEDVSELRKAASKSLGEEYFGKFKDKFVDGALKNGADETEAVSVWESMVTFGCLSGDTIIKLPTSNQYSPKEITIKQLYENGGYAKIATGYNRVHQIKRGLSKVLSMTERGKTIKPVQMKSIYESGVKETFELKTRFNSIRATANHMFFTLHGWMPLSDLVPGMNVAIMGSRFPTPSGLIRYPGTGSGAHNQYGLETTNDIEQYRQIIRDGIECDNCDSDAENVHHIDGDRHNNDKSNIEFLCCKCHRNSHEQGYPFKRGRQVEFAKIISIGNPKMEMTYDIEMPIESANFVANDFVVHNSWGFNKSHAYSYGLISYWTAWCKAHYPLEFAVANLNHARSDDQALKILRDIVRNDHLDYIPFDPDLSVERWSTHDGKLLGGLRSLKGIGPKKAKSIMDARAGKTKFTPSMIHAIKDPDTIFNILFPCEHWWGDIFERPEEFGLENPPTVIEKITKPGDYLLIGRMVDRNLRDLNETQSVARRGGKVLTDHTLFLNLILEDDTDSIVVTVNRYKYEQIGRKIAETGKVGHDWFLVKGTIKDKWRRVDVKEILNLNTWGKENNIGPDSKLQNRLG